jgi:transposase-like protein
MKVIKCPLSKHRARFGTEEQCREYLSEQKWKAGFKCKKCEHTDFVKGRMHLDRRCKKCGYNESPTSGTLFHSTKLSLVLLFEILFRVSVNKKGMSSISIAREYGVNQKTAYSLRCKIQLAMASSESIPLAGEVHIDEFFFGSTEEGKYGRDASSNKLRACIAVEKLPDNLGIGRAYAIHIDNFSTKELRKIFERHCANEASIVTDQWIGYKALKEDYPNLTQIKSEKGHAFPELHIVILLIKKFLRGTHHIISAQRFQQYLSEFCYRFNRRAHIENINTNLIDRMITHKYNKPDKAVNHARAA